MTQKSPVKVVNTISNSFQYVIANYLSLVKVFLIPSLLISLPLGYFVLTAFPDVLDQIVLLEESDDPQLVMETVGALFALYPVMILGGLVYYAMIMVPISRHIMTGEPLGLLRFDRYVLKTMLGIVVLSLLLIVLFFVIVLAFALVAGLLGALLGEMAAGLMAIVMIFGVIALGFIVMVRLSVYLPDVAVSGRIRLRESAELTEGSFWQIVGVLVLLAAVSLVLSMVAEFVIGLGLGIAMAMDAGAIATMDDDPGAFLRLLGDFVRTPLGMIGLVGYFFFVVFSTGLNIAVSAFLYRSLTSDRNVDYGDEGGAEGGDL